MADSTLDDFFAKKDKSKKGKSKSKYTTSETIAKKLEEGGRRPDIPPKKDTKEKIPISSNIQSITIPSVTNEQIRGGFPCNSTLPPKKCMYNMRVQSMQTFNPSMYSREKEDDEWKNIEEKETDYSGLRIQALSISEKEKEEEQLKEQMLSEQNGESQRQSDSQSGPWKVVQTPVVEAEVEQPPQEPAVKEEPTPKPTGTYKPPAMRNVSASTPLSSSGRRHPKNAPQISSELHFPSLSSAVDNKFKLSESDRSFQSVKHGVRSKGETQGGLRLDLENKFSALHQGE